MKELILTKISISGSSKPLLFVFGSIFISLNFISLFIFPLGGMWQLIDSQKLIKGALLYDDVKTVCPPLFYLVFIPFVKLGIKSLFFFREEGVLLLSLTFSAFFVILRNYLSLARSIAITFITYAIYLITPWEMFLTYLYLASIFGVMSVYLYYKNPKLSFFLCGLALVTKVTIGGGILIGYAIHFIILSSLRLYKKQVDLKRFLFVPIVLSLCLLLGVSLPFLLLWFFDVNWSLSYFFNLVFSGESKGGFSVAALNPIKNFIDYWGLLRFDFGGYPDLSQTPLWQVIVYYFRPIKIVFNSLLGVGVLLPLIFFSTSLMLLWESLFLVRTRRFSRLITYFPIVASVAGASYSSAMSSNFKPDDIFLIMFFIVVAFNALIHKKEFLWIILGVFIFAFIFYGITSPLIVFIISTLTVTFLILIFQKYFAHSNYLFLSVVVLLAATFSKVYLTSFAWWENNIRGREVVEFRDGFFVSDFQKRVILSLDTIKLFSEENNIAMTAYSFPTSVLPYHYFSYLPPWHFITHHADVFPKRFLLSEKKIIEGSYPNYVFVSQWTQEKILELDGVFSPGSMSSQHIMGIYLKDILRNKYFLCAAINSHQNEVYNHPLEIYISNRLLVDKKMPTDDLCNLLTEIAE